MILSNSIRDILRYSLTSTSQHSCVLFLGTKKDRAKHSRHVQPAGKPYNMCIDCMNQEKNMDIEKGFGYKRPVVNTLTPLK